MANIDNVVKSPIKGKTGTIKRSSGYEYRDFWYTNASGQKVHVVGWHRAIDITTLGEVVAFARGKVVSIQKGITGQTTNPSGGNSVVLEHANGCKTTYCHLDNGSNNHLKIGDIVEEGAKLGTDTIKTTGNSTGLHLHFAIYDPNQTYQDSHYVNPIDYLQGKKKLVGYGETPNSSSTSSTTTSTGKFKIGDRVIISGGLYVNANAANPSGHITNKETTITRYVSGTKHPYNTTGDLGWINESDIRLVSSSSSTSSTTTYIVKSGDTLSSIARKYGTTWQKLYEKNKSVIGSNPNLIYPNQKLTI